MANANSLAGFVKPDYFNSGNIKLKTGVLSFIVKADDAQALLDFFLPNQLADEFKAATLIWEQSNLLDDGLYLLANLLKQVGLDYDCDFISPNESDSDMKAVSELVNEFQLAAKSPDAMASFIKRHEADKVETPTQVSVTIS